jgi:hypothetical protein
MEALPEQGGTAVKMKVLPEFPWEKSLVILTGAEIREGDCGVAWAAVSLASLRSLPLGPRG